MPMKENKSAKNLLWAFLAILAYNVTATILITAAYGVFSEETMQAHYFMTDALIVMVQLVICLVWLVRISRREGKSFLSGDAFTQPYVLVSIPVLVLGISGISGMWLGIAEEYLQGMPIISESLESFEETWSTIYDESYLWVFLSVVLVGPIVEELLFRGLVFHYLEKFKAGWFPIVVSGIAFGLWHIEPVQAVYAAIIGMVYGLLYSRFRDLRLTIVLHVLNNFLSTLPPALDIDPVQSTIAYGSFLMIIPALAILIQMAVTQDGTS